MSTKYKLRITGECKQNMKLCKRRGLPMNELWTVVGKLLNGEQLEEKYQAHVLTGDRKGQWECHIQPDWLLVWGDTQSRACPCTPKHGHSLRPVQQEV